MKLFFVLLLISILLIAGCSAKQETSSQNYPIGPELQGIAGYINTNHTTIQEHRGKVVLVDFWTYSCINCIRTLPYLNEWHEKYSDKGLVIIGVHTPEFEFEKDIDNVKAAVTMHGIKYPVALDNDYKTWRAYKNAYWPRKYILDVDGSIRYDHIGEGGYEETEAVIQQLLKERAERLKGKVNFTDEMSSPESAIPVEFSKIGTPEIYFGYNFIRQKLGNGEVYLPEATVSYSLPEKLEKNIAYLEGNWTIKPDYMELQADEGKIALAYYAKAANIVAGSDSGSAVQVLADGQLNKTIVKEFRLYNIVFSDYGEHSLELAIKGRGFRIYTFTFG